MSEYTVDWGDGAVEANITDLYHEYSEPGRYVINIVGDIEKITHIGGVYNDANIEAIDLSRLTGLISFNFTMALMPKEIDLSNCARLGNLTLSECRRIEKIKLPNSPNLYSVVLSGSKLNTEAISDAINHVYHNALTHELTYGEIWVQLSSYDGDDVNKLAG